MLRDERAEQNGGQPALGDAVGNRQPGVIIDERGEPVPTSAIAGLAAARELARYPSSAAVHNVITSAAAVEIIREHGGTPSAAASATPT